MSDGNTLLGRLAKRLSGFKLGKNKLKRKNFMQAFISSAGGRKVNQDYFDTCTSGNYHCWLVADGLGGHGGGEVASKLICEKIVEDFSCKPALENLEQCFDGANTALLAAQQAEERYTAMQSTIVGLVTDGIVVRWGHIGDSRLYMFREGKIIHQTQDHSVVQALVSAGVINGDEMRQHEDRNKLLRAVGSKKEVRYTMCLEPIVVQEGDAFLLCTDGFWDYVCETEMLIDWASSLSPDDWLSKMEQRLCKLATGEFDNYTAVAIWVSEV